MPHDPCFWLERTFVLGGVDLQKWRRKKFQVWVVDFHDGLVTFMMLPLHEERLGISAMNVEPPKDKRS